MSGFEPRSRYEPVVERVPGSPTGTVPGSRT